jgi:cytochrome c biogenesis protein CcdA
VGTSTAVQLAFATAAASIILIMAFMLLLIGTAQNRFLQPLRAGVQSIKQGGGLLLIVVGIWLMILAIWADKFTQIFPI